MPQKKAEITGRTAVGRRGARSPRPGTRSGSRRQGGGASAGVLAAWRESPTESTQSETLDVPSFLASTGVKTRQVTYASAGNVFKQGDACDSVVYIQSGLVKISVVSATGRQAVVAMLGPGDFCGVGGLAGQPVRMETATATSGTVVLVVDQMSMVRLLQEQHAMSDMLIAYLLKRTIRVEEDLIDQLFSSSERRLARKLLILARYREPDRAWRALPALSQETLAEMVGTTRSRVNFFMKKFERLGFVDYKHGLRVHDSLLTVALQDD